LELLGFTGGFVVAGWGSYWDNRTGVLLNPLFPLEKSILLIYLCHKLNAHGLIQYIGLVSKDIQFLLTVGANAV